MPTHGVVNTGTEASNVQSPTQHFCTQHKCHKPVHGRNLVQVHKAQTGTTNCLTVCIRFSTGLCAVQFPELAPRPGMPPGHLSAGIMPGADISNQVTHPAYQRFYRISTVARASTVRRVRQA